MDRRLFLQLLGVGGLGAAVTPLVVVEGEAAVEVGGLPHYVMDYGSYTGRMFDGNRWVRGTNAALTRFRPRTVSEHYTLQQLDAVDPALGRTGQALALFRAKVQADVESLLAKNPRNREGRRPFEEVEPDAVVTVIGRDFLRVHHFEWPNTHGLGGSHSECVILMSTLDHFLVQGSVHPRYLWSSDGRIPLADEFGFAFNRLRDERTRSKVVRLEGIEPTGPSAPSSGVLKPSGGLDAEALRQARLHECRFGRS